MRESVEATDRNNSDLTWVSQVRQFQLEKMAKRLPNFPVTPDSEVRIDCIGRLYEEHRETATAILEGDLEGVADGIADLIYTAIGVALLHGFDPGPIFAEVHAANMEKGIASGSFGRTTAAGTSTKANWSPPRIAALLNHQIKGST